MTAVDHAARIAEDWPCDDYKAPLTCYTVPNGPKHLTCGGCREAFPSGPEVQRLYRLPEAEVTEEWGVRYGDGEIDWFTVATAGKRDSERPHRRDEAEAYIAECRERIASPDWGDAADDYEPMALVRRTRTRYAEHVTEWEAVDE